MTGGQAGLTAAGKSDSGRQWLRSSLLICRGVAVAIPRGIKRLLRKGCAGAMLHEKSCGALVLRNQKGADGAKKTYILMIRHTNGGHRSFPKGHVEKGETERMTAEREVFEETSVRIHISEHFREAVYYKPRPNSSKEVIYFLAFTRQSSIRSQEGEIAEVEWVPLEEAREALTHENDKNIFDLAMEYLRERKLGGF